MYAIRSDYEPFFPFFLLDPPPSERWSWPWRPAVPAAAPPGGSVITSYSIHYTKLYEVSTKHCIEICKYIKGRKVEDARKLLQAAIEKTAAIPFPRFNGGVGHKRGKGMARNHFV